MVGQIKKYLLLCATCLLCRIYLSSALNLPGPRVYVVTPATRPLEIHEGRAAPFYYHNWMRRMDTPQNNISTTTTTTTPKADTHDLIFAEFEKDNGDAMQKSIRKLLEKERVNVESKHKVNNIMNDDNSKNSEIVKHWTPVKDEGSLKEDNSDQINDYMSMYNNLYSTEGSPVYLPSATVTSPTPMWTPPTTTEATADMNHVKNVWHIIDDAKYNQYTGKWEEQEIKSNNNENVPDIRQSHKGNGVMNNFVFAGLNSTSDNRSENESRAIRTENDYRFPYVNLKTLQMKKPMSSMYNNKGNNLYTNLDNFQDVKHPIRGEAQDLVPNRTPIDRYNSAQPYFPPDQKNSKQSSSRPAGPMKAVASLVPPPPPKAPGDYLPPPMTYDSFPPYPPSAPPSAPDNSPPSIYSPPTLGSDSDSDSDSDGPPPDSDDSDSDSPPSGYEYRQPPSNFIPTIPPPMISKPSDGGYSYEKPQMSDDSPPMMEDTHPKYHYPKPHEMDDHPPSYGYGSHDHHHHHHHQPPQDAPDYPELILNKPHGGMDDSKGGGDDDTMDMVPPPPPEMKPMDHDFPHDFPTDFKYHDDDEEFYHHHHHHHTTTTTTTTTEMPRVNRYSYYYLGKKLYYIPLYFSAYFVAYVAALVIKAILRHKIVYPNSFRPADNTGTFLSKRSVDSPSWNFSDEKLHEVTRLVTDALYNAAEKYMNKSK